MRWFCVLVGIALASPVYSGQFDVLPDVEQQECTKGVDYRVHVKLPIGRSLAALTQRARSRASLILSRYLFGSKIAQTVKTKTVDSHKSSSMTVEISRFSITQDVLRGMVYRSRKIVGAEILFVYTLSYSKELSKEVYELVCIEN